MRLTGATHVGLDAMRDKFGDAKEKARDTIVEVAATLEQSLTSISVGGAVGDDGVVDLGGGGSINMGTDQLNSAAASSGSLTTSSLVRASA